MLGSARQHRGRVVRAHGPDGLLPRERHRRKKELQVLLRVAECLLGVQQGLAGRCHGGDVRRQLVQRYLGLLQPLLVGPGAGQLGLDLGVVDDAALLQVDEEHLARLQAPLLDDLLLGDVEHSHLGGHDDHVVVGDQVACRAQAVAVQGRADLPAVGEGHRGGSVPGLHQGGVVLVEGAPLLVHQIVAGPGLRNQQHHRVGQGVAAHHQELQGIVEAGRVGLTLGDQGPDLVQVVAQDLRLHGVAARRHPVDVAAQGIDLPVVADHAERMGQVPGGEGVGGEALVHQGQGGLETLVLQVLVVTADLAREQHALVGDGARGHGGHVVGGLLVTGLPDLVVHALADGEQLALEAVLVRAAPPAADEHLADDRLGREHALAQDAVVHRDIAPAQDPVPTLGQMSADDRLHLVTGVCLLGKEDVTHAVLTGGGQSEAHHRAEKGIGNLDQDTGTVPCLRIGADRAPVSKTLEDLQPLPDDLAALAVLDVADEADAAGVTFVSRVIESLRGR